MEILGIGPLELLFIVLIALIVLGPKDMIKAGKTIGRTLRTIVSSDTWRVVNQASREVRNLPNRLIREAGIDELQKQLPNQRELSKQLGIDELNQSMQSAAKPAAQYESHSAQQATASVDISPWTTNPQTIAPPRNSDRADTQVGNPGEAPSLSSDASITFDSSTAPGEETEDKDDPPSQENAKG
jgi:sec-independent protein translocase protein TatB